MNELTVKDLTKANLDQEGYICTKTVETDADKKTLFNAINSPDFVLLEQVNKTIVVTDLVFKPYESVDELTGEVTELIGITLIDKDGKSYTTASKGVLNSIKTLIAVYGSPSWVDGIKIVPKQKAISKGNKMLYLELA